MFGKTFSHTDLMKWPCLTLKACQQHKYLFVLYIEKLLKHNINRRRGLIKLNMFGFLHVAYFYMLNSGLSKKFTRVTWVASFHTILDVNGDIKGIIVTHCKLDLLKVLDIKVPFACLMGQKLFAVHLIFDFRRKWNLTFATSDGSENMCFTQLWQFNCTFGITAWWKIHQISSFWCIYCWRLWCSWWEFI